MVRDWIFGIAGALAACGVLRIAFLLLFRRPVAARLRDTSYGEAERLHDRDMHLAALVDGKPTPEDIHYRGVTARVAYEIDGVEHRADVLLVTHKGDRTDSAPLVWVDPRDPNRATGLGLGVAMMALIAAGGLVVLGWRVDF
jgi:hypothetical protein